MYLDIIIVAIFILLIIIGVRKGAARTLLTVIGSFVSYLVASYLGAFLAQWIYDKYIAVSVSASISSAVSSAGLTDISTASQSAIEQMPFIAKMALTVFNYDFSASFSNAAASAPDKIASVVNSAISPVVVSFLSFILSILLFFAVFFLIRVLVIRLLLRVFRLPGLRQLNGILGGVFGAVNALLLISFAAFLLKILLPNIDNVPYIISESQIYNSYIFYYFYSGNIFTALTSLVG